MTHMAGISFGVIGAYLATHQVSAWGWFFTVSLIIELAALLMDFSYLNPQFRNHDD